MNSPKTLILAGLVLIAVAFGAGYALKDRQDSVDKSATPTPSPTASVSATPTPRPVSHSVRLLPSGPVPKVLTVRAGDSVTFTNEASTEYHPASNRCPGFDSRRGLRYGDTYTLTFVTARTCDYSNQLDPNNAAQKGSVIVQ